MSYPKVYRLPLHKYNDAFNLDPPWEELPGRYYMDEHQVAQVIGPGHKIIREKMNGSTRHFQLKHYLVHYEDVRKRRVIPYTKLPRYQFVFAVENVVTGQKLNVQETIKFCEEYGLLMPHIILIEEGSISIGDLVEIAQRPSHYNPDHRPEGIIIMNEGTGMEGKIINSEYDDNKHPDIYDDHKFEAELEDNIIDYF